MGSRVMQAHGGTHELLGRGALLTRAWKAESLSLMAVSASLLKAFTCAAKAPRSCAPALSSTVRSVGPPYML